MENQNIMTDRRRSALPIRHRDWLFLMMVGVLLSLLGLPGQTVRAATTGTWQAVGSQINVSLSNPLRNRRSNDATVNVQLSNGGGAIAGPLRLVIGGVSPANKVSIGSPDGQTDTAEPYFSLNNFAANASATVKLTVLGGGPNIFSISPRVEHLVAPPVQNLTVKITTPASLITVGRTPITVQGTVSDPTANLTLNGAPVKPGGDGSFSANVSLQEGNNTIIADAKNAAGQEVTDSLSVSLDRTPPYVTIESPADGTVVYDSTVDVSGLVNDIVRGTVSAGQANVTVNGKTATVSNRSYSALAVPLAEGSNTLSVSAADDVGNVGHAQTTVIYTKPGAKHVQEISGNNQGGKIGTAVANPLKVQLVDEKGQPVAGQGVIFRVTQGDGVVGVGTADIGQASLANTGADGTAATGFQLGSRAGQGNQRVRATAVGFDGEVVFSASADPSAGSKVSVNSGNNQRGAVSQPLPLPLVAVVTDDGANVVAGASIEFKVTQGTGIFQNGAASYTVKTDSDGRASAKLTLGPDEGLDGQRATATLVGTSLYAGFTASGLKSGDAGNTRISGVVQDNQDAPLPKVTVRVDGTTRQAETDAQGKFQIDNAPVGPVRLVVDGSTTTVAGEWPTLPFNIVTIAGADNPLSAPVHLVKLDTAHAVTIGTQDAVITLADVPGFKLEVKAGSATFPDGKKTGKISVTPVNADKVPMPPPNGMQPQFIVTIQPVGTKFDPPAKLTLPNVDGHKPGAQVEMYSFDHDLEEFVSIGLGTVSADGSLIASNPGVGVIKAGWHCGSQPGGSGCCTSCGSGECVVQDSSCACKTLPTPPDAKGDCQSPVDCKRTQPNPGDKPDPNVAPDNFCKTCDNNGNIVADSTKDGSPVSNDICKVCFNGAGTNVSVDISNAPDTVCVGESKTMVVTLVPEILQSKFGPAKGTVVYGPNGSTDNTGLVDLSFNINGQVSIKGTKAYGSETKLSFWPFDILRAPGGKAYCDSKDISLYVTPKTVATQDSQGEIGSLLDGLPSILGVNTRYQAYDFLVQHCPDHKSVIPNKVNHWVDGCSTPGHKIQSFTDSIIVAAYNTLYCPPPEPQNPIPTPCDPFNNLYNSEPLFGADQGSIPYDSKETLGCNVHDINYQTCGYSQADADKLLKDTLVEACDTGYGDSCPRPSDLNYCLRWEREKSFCEGYAQNVVYPVLSAVGTWAWTARQIEYCSCCGATK